MNPGPVLYMLGLFDGEILYKLQLVQPMLYELQLVQTACTNCNLYRHFVQVATRTKTQLVHNIYITSHYCPLIMHCIPAVPETFALMWVNVAIWRDCKVSNDSFKGILK